MTTRILNDELLSYLESYSSTFPIRWSKLYSALDDKRHTSGAALPHAITSLAPKFFEHALSLVNNNPALCKRTILYGVSNACPVCSKPMDRPTDSACSRKCRGSSPEVLAKYRATSRKNYGTDSYMQSVKGQELFRKGFFDKYGVDNPQKHAGIKARTQATNIRKYGGTSPNHSPAVRDKAKATMVLRFGVENPGQNPDMIRRREANNLADCGYKYHSMSPKNKKEVVSRNTEKYGVGNAMQHPDIIERCRRATHNRKTYVETNGRVHDTLQGYEPQVIHWMNTVRSVENFVTRPSMMPTIQTSTGKVYLPDARFKHKGVCYLLEVKCDHTLLDDWVINLDKFRKAKAWCEDNGFVFMLAISNGKFGTRPTFIKSPTIETIKIALAKFWTSRFIDRMT